MFRFGIGVASPSISLSTPAMMRIRVDLPEPFRPSRPIFAPGKNDSEMSFRIWRLGGTILPTRFMVKTYWAIGGFGCLEVDGFRFYGGLRPDGCRFLSLRRETPGFSTRRCVSRSAREVTTLYFDGYGRPWLSGRRLSASTPAPECYLSVTRAFSAPGCDAAMARTRAAAMAAEAPCAVAASGGGAVRGFARTRMRRGVYGFAVMIAIGLVVI